MSRTLATVLAIARSERTQIWNGHTASSAGGVRAAAAQVEDAIPRHIRGKVRLVYEDLFRFEYHHAEQLSQKWHVHLLRQITQFPSC